MRASARLVIVRGGPKERNGNRRERDFLGEEISKKRARKSVLSKTALLTLICRFFASFGGFLADETRLSARFAEDPAAHLK